MFGIFSTAGQKRRRKTVRGLEGLETRTLLSAGHHALPADTMPGDFSGSWEFSDKTGQVDFTQEGTKVTGNVSHNSNINITIKGKVNGNTMTVHAKGDSFGAKEHFKGHVTLTTPTHMEGPTRVKVQGSPAVDYNFSLDKIMA
ncbi:MAG: hypothetical protein U0903_20070 [Planctomycetales bacterium]